MKRALLILLVITLSLSCLLISLEKHSFNYNNYSQSFSKYKVSEKTGKNMEELMDITEDIFIYLRGKAGDEILEANFNQREVLHMRDVQVLFKYGFILKYLSIILSIIIIVIFLKNGEKDLLGRYIYKGLFLNWILIGLLVVLTYFDFNKYFTYFHLIFFSNDLWILDPTTDLLIQMLPEGFFIDISIKIGLSFLGNLAIIQGISFIVTRKGRIKNEQKGKGKSIR